MNILAKWGKKDLAIFITLVTIFAVALGTTLGLVFMPKLNSYNSSNMSSNAVMVGELWDGSSAFYTDRVNQLMHILTNNSSGTISKLSSNIGTGIINASTIRGYTTGKTSGKGVVVRLGGLDWLVTFLSKSGTNVITTLWLADTEQDAWANSSGKIDSLGYATYSSGSINSRWSANWYYSNNSAPGKYPSNMYGTSYMRAVTLNNGGGYATGDSTNGCNADLTSATQSISSPFAKFTMSSVAGSLTDYLVTPNAISWQTETTASSQSSGYNNESLNLGYGATTNALNYYENTDVDRTGYQAWGTDYLWLPSYSETGYSDSFTGLWGLSVAERSNSTKYAWLRSASIYNARDSYALYPSGSRLYSNAVSDSYAVRPALHLNLTSVASNATAEIPTSSVTLNKNGGSGGTDSITALYEGPMPSATAPTRTGYTFNGYYTATSGGTKYYNADMTSAKLWDKQDATATLYAQWLINTTITFDKNGGSGGTDSVTVTYGNSMPTATAPTRTGYTFNGYYTATSGGTKYYNANMTSAQNWDKKDATATLYAQWISDCTITFDKNGGSGGTDSVVAKYNSVMPSATAPTKEGYDFVGYYDATSGGTKYYNADMTSARTWNKDQSTATLYAQWLKSISSIITSNVDYTLTNPSNNYYPWEYNDAGYIKSTNEGIGSSASGFMISYTASVGDTISISYKVSSESCCDKIKIKVNNSEQSLSKDGGNNTTYTTYTYTVSTAVTLNIEILYYKDNSVNHNNDCVYINDITIAALVYDLTINPNGGTFNGTTSNTTISQSKGTTYTISNPTRTGYTFNGWTLSGAGTLSGTTYTFGADNGTLTAQWTAITYTLTYALNGGTLGGSTSNQTESFNINKSLTAKSAPTKTGYTFTGWKVTTSTAGGWTNGKNYSAGASIGTGKYANATLTAQWSINSYTITVNVNDSNMGSVTGGGTYNYNTNVTLTAITKSSYSFQYWLRASDGQKFTDNPLTITIPAQNETYTAVFGKALNNNGACLLDVAEVNSSNQIVTNNTELKCLGTATIMGYSKVDGLDSVHLYTWASSGYKFAYWAVQENDGTLTILKNSGGTAYKDCCDIPINQVKDKVVIACFIKKTSAVDDTTGNT